MQSCVLSFQDLYAFVFANSTFNGPFAMYKPMPRVAIPVDSSTTLEETDVHGVVVVEKDDTLRQMHPLQILADLLNVSSFFTVSMMQLKN